MIKLIFYLFILFSIALSAAEEFNFLPNIENQLNASIDDKIQLSVEKSQLESQINLINKKTNLKKILIVKRLQALYSLKKFNWGQLLFNNNFNELEKNIKILKNLNHYDYILFKEYSSSLKLLALSRKNLQETELLIQKNIETLKTQQDKFQQAEALRIISLQKENLNSLLIFKGSLPRPLDGYVKQEFGSMSDQNNQFYLINRGELYLSKLRTPVKSIGPGMIIFRDELMRWRETLIIQHDDNYYSVYAGITNSKKTVGERVLKNELIGLTASENLYFELRHFDNPINPKTWFKE